MFNVGDRVEFISDIYGKDWIGQLATVHKLSRGGPYVTFDNLEYQRKQNASCHWPQTGFFRVIDKPEDFEFDL